jgi:hypothetical protein
MRLLDKLVVRIRDEQVSQKLANESFVELEKHFSEISLATPLEPQEIFPDAIVVFTNRSGEAGRFIATSFDPELPKWSKPWSFVQYLELFKEEVKRRDMQSFLFIDDEISEDSRLMKDFGLILTEFDLEKPLSDAIKRLAEITVNIHDAVERQLTANLNRGSLVTFFDFPPTVRVACEQYLQYFVQFLEDLGIEADSEISSSAGRVLFSVTPRSGDEALEAIQKALGVYLDLSTKNDASNYDLTNGDFAVSQLRSNILHLQGQLMTAQAMHQLAQATIQAKDTTINAQAMQLSMFQSGQLFQNGASEVRRIGHSNSESRQDSEPLIGDNVKVTALKLKGIEVDLPNLLRSLKRKLPGSRGR